MYLQVLINGLSLGSVYAIIAVGFALVFNILKFSNFSHGGVMTVTAYVGFLAAKHLEAPLVLTILVAILTGGLLAVFAEFVAFRRIRRNKGPVIYYFVSSITLGILFENLITIFFSTNFYSFPDFFETSTLKLGEVVMSVSDLMMFLISCTSLIILAFIIYRTKIGTAVRAVSYDFNTASLMGINVNVVIMAVFFLAGGLGGISGVFLGINYTLYPQLGQLVVKGFIASVIGGLGSLHGAVMGAFLLGLVEILLVQIIGSGFAPVFIFIIMLGFLLIRPRGIAGINIQEKA